MNQVPPSGAPDEVRCSHCGESHPSSFVHCPRTGRPVRGGAALVGTVLGGRYRIVAMIGEGGMGAVYEAEHLHIGRRVALKRLHPELALDAKAVARFQREARAAAATGHHNVVEVLDLGFGEDGAPYLVMEYLRGRSLAHVLRTQGRLPPSRAVHIVGQVLSALDAVHRHGIVHRDLKPDNVLLVHRHGRADWVKVVDFGVSKMRGQEPLDLTRTGVMVGTPYYMSPEQARGVRTLDHRVDVYAAGVMLYETLSGRLPFQGANYHALLQAILSAEPTPLVDLVPDLDPALDAVVRTAIARDPEQRFPTARAMWEALVPFGAPPLVEHEEPVEISPMGASAPPRAPRTVGYAPSGSRSADGPREATSSADAGSRTVAAAHDQRAATRRPIARTPHSNVEAARDAGGAGPPVGSASRRSEAVAAGSPSEVAGATPAPRVGAWRAVGAGDELGDDEPALREVLAQVPRPRRHAPVPHRFEARSAEAGRPTTPQSYEARPRLVALSTPQPADWARPDEAVRAASPSSAYAAAVRDGDASRIKGSLFLALADHLEASSGPGSYERLVASLEPSVRAELPSVVLPLAWLPLRLYQRLLAAADRLWGGSEGAVASAVGEATASRELPVTHRLLLHSATPATAAARLPQLLRSYHDASGFGVEPIAGGARVDLGSWQPPDAVYERMLAGFARRTVEMAGGRDVRATIHASRAAGDPRSVLVLRWR